MAATHSLVWRRIRCCRPSQKNKRILDKKNPTKKNPEKNLLLYLVIIVVVVFALRSGSCLAVKSRNQQRQQNCHKTSMLQGRLTIFMLKISVTGGMDRILFYLCCQDTFNHKKELKLCIICVDLEEKRTFLEFPKKSGFFFLDFFLGFFRFFFSHFCYWILTRMKLKATLLYMHLKKKSFLKTNNFIL